MSVLRFFATLFLLVAVVAFVADATPYLSGTGAWHWASVKSYWVDIAPATFEAFQSWLAQSAAIAWAGPVILRLLDVPAVILFILLALICGWYGRRRSRVKVFAN
jgi:hypothetical protein